MSKRTVKTKRKVRCAIYTRKSSEEGLEQDFNSLDAQRESCEAYIQSQRGEGWEALPGRYDDGGFSGGGMKRPALKRLLSDVEAGQVDAIVVYKIDRLTRALSDFVKMVEIFDAHEVSFVSVTQAFNTTTSMGRLTLNVLLSFAQFEREVTGERIRDKIAASKKKGMWMGGPPPLGYDAIDRKLVINQQEAETVRRIYQKYSQFGSVRRLKEELDAEGTLSKVRKGRNGRRWGGRPFARGALYLMLQNRIYLGEVVHKERSYQGKHEAIIDRELWVEAQKKLEANRVSRRVGGVAKSPSLLAGLLYDDHGERMTPSHAVKKGKRYRYYVSRSLITKNKETSPGGLRIPAGEIEGIVSQRLQGFFTNRSEVFDTIESYVKEGAEQKRLFDQAASLSKNWSGLPPTRTRQLLLVLILRIEVHPEKIDIHVALDRIVDIFRDDFMDLPPAHTFDQKDDYLILTVPARLKRSGKEMKMLIDGEAGRMAGPDPALVKLIARAHSLKEKLISGGGASLREIARRERVESSYFTRIVRLTFLSPDITKAILDGRQPPGLTASRLMRDTRFPLDWKEQREELGFT